MPLPEKAGRRRQGDSDYLPGVVLFGETVHQKASDGRLLAEVLKEQGVIPGIKADGAKEMALSPGEICDR